jgi:hypothetical protein
MYCRSIQTPQHPLQSFSPTFSLLSGPLICLTACLISRVNLLLQDNAVHARLKQCKNQACLPLQLSQAVQDLGRGRPRHRIQQSRKLHMNVSRHSKKRIARRETSRLRVLWAAGSSSAEKERVPSSCCPRVARTRPAGPAPAGIHPQGRHEQWRGSQARKDPSP